MRLSLPRASLTLALLTLGSYASGAGTISVTSDGTAHAPLVSVELRFRVDGEDAMVLDAYKSFKAAKARGTKAVRSLEVKGLTIEPEGMKFGPVVANPNAIMMAGGGMAPTPSKMSVSEILRVVVPLAGLSGEDALLRLGEVTDTAVEAGMKPAGAAPQDPQAMIFMALMGGDKPDDLEDPFATLRPGDKNALRKSAQKAAIAAARALAEDLAGLSGLAIGGVQSIEVEIAGDLSMFDKNQVSCRVKLKVVFTTS